MSMRDSRINYEEGSLIAVPLQRKGWALGVVARLSGKGALLVYFFGPVYKAPPRAVKTFSKRAQDAILVVRCGDLGLLERRWKVIGRIQEWDRQAWPMPWFVRTDVVTGTHLRIMYSDDNLTKQIAAVPC